MVFNFLSPDLKTNDSFSWQRRKEQVTHGLPKAKVSLFPLFFRLRAISLQKQMFCGSASVDLLLSSSWLLDAARYEAF